MVRNHTVFTRNFIIPINGILSYLFQEVQCDNSSEDMYSNSDSIGEIQHIEDKIFNALLSDKKEISIPKTNISLQTLLKVSGYILTYKEDEVVVNLNLKDYGF